METTMDSPEHAAPQAEITRRRLLQALAALGITGPLAVDLVAQSRGRLSGDVIKQASAVLGEQFTPERIAVIEKALQRNLDQFQIVRDLVIDDSVEPATVFTPRAQASMVRPTGRRKVS
jgi:hypothetical protein